MKHGFALQFGAAAAPKCTVESSALSPSVEGVQRAAIPTPGRGRICFSR